MREFGTHVGCVHQVALQVICDFDGRATGVVLTEWLSGWFFKVLGHTQSSINGEGLIRVNIIQCGIVRSDRGF